MHDRRLLRFLELYSWCLWAATVGALALLAGGLVGEVARLLF